MKSKWSRVKKIMGKNSVSLGAYLSFQFLYSPRRILYTLSYYKFAAKIIGVDKRVLDVGCGEGLGTWLLAKECGFAHGIDIDDRLIAVGAENWQDKCISFSGDDFLNTNQRKYDAVVSFDVIEHIVPHNAGLFWKKVCNSLVTDGIAIIGTPNITAHQYASAVTAAGHVNLYEWERLEAEMRDHFKHVFMFGANDEIVHTGFLPMAHYLLYIGCHKR